MVPDILYEDNHIIIVNKKSSELVQGDKTGDESLDIRVKQYLKEKYNKPGNVYLGVVHRIDRPVSGIVVFTRTSKALSRMNKKFKDRELKKVYWAIVQNCPPQQQATLNHYILRNQKQNKSYSSLNDKPGSKLASLDYALVGNSQKYFFLQVELHTGRHHQIRSQLTEIGSPIKGDLKYGAKRSNPDGSICLHARELVFNHPVSQKELKIIADTPEGILWDEFKLVVNQ